MFNAVFFLLEPKTELAAIWISYGFIHAAFLLLVISPFTCRKESVRVFGVSLMLITLTYFYLVLTAGCIVIILAPISPRIPLILYIVLTGLYLVLYLGSLIFNETSNQEKQIHTQELRYVKEAASRVKYIEGQLQRGEAKKAVERLYDVVSTSPVKTAPAAAEAECQVIDQLVALEQMLPGATDTELATHARQILAIAENRNRILRTLQSENA